MKAYTDAPIKELGDVSGETAPIRECEILSYDGDKYCIILVEGVKLEVKAGYIYKEKGRIGEVSCFSYRDLGCLPLTEYEDNCD